MGRGVVRHTNRYEIKRLIKNNNNYFFEHLLLYRKCSR